MRGKKKRIRAIRDFVILHPDDVMKTMPGTFIVVPESAKDMTNPPSGVVVSVGDGLVEGGNIIPLKVKVGQRVYIPRNAGTLIRNHPLIEDCFIVRENQIFGWDDVIGRDEAPELRMDAAAL